jgi:phospholipase A-2-activating protein
MLEINNMLNYSKKDIKDIVVTDSNIICGGREELVFLTDLASSSTARLHPHSGNVNSLAFDGKSIFCGCQNGQINIFDMDFKQKTTLNGHNGNVCCLDIRKNILLSGSWDHKVKVWDISTRKLLASLDHPGTVWSVKFIDDNRFVSGCADKLLRIYNNNILESTLALHNFCIRSVCVKDNLIYSIDNEGTLLKISLDGDLLSHHSFRDFMYSVISYGENILCCGENGKIFVLNQNLHILDEVTAPCTSCWKAVVHNNIVYVCGSDGTVYVFNDYNVNNEMRDQYDKLKEERGQYKEFASNGEKYKVVDNYVYQLINNEWVHIGEQGPSYDYSFSVELEGKYYTLSFNKRDNVHEVAENFLKINKLNPEFHDEIVDYIKNNFKQDNYRTYDSINKEGVEKLLMKYTNIKYIFKNLGKFNKKESKMIESELLWILNNGPRFVALDLYRYFVVCGFDFDLTFLLRFQAKDRKESLAFIRLVTVLYCDPPFNLECLFVVVQKLRDIGYLSDEDLDDYYNNRTVRKQLQSRNY